MHSGWTWAHNYSIRWLQPRWSPFFCNFSVRCVSGCEVSRSEWSHPSVLFFFLIWAVNLIVFGFVPHSLLGLWHIFATKCLEHYSNCSVDWTLFSSLGSLPLRPWDIWAKVSICILTWHFILCEMTHQLYLKHSLWGHASQGFSVLFFLHGFQGSDLWDVWITIAWSQVTWIKVW